MITVTVKLNGTSTNPYVKMGFKRNPFPVIAKAEYAAFDQLLGDLASEPIRDVEHLRTRLAGCSKEFVDLCCEQFKSGEFAKFDITIP